MTSVPCNGCTACCKNDLIVLHPEIGDDPSTYITMAAVNPLTGQTCLALQQKPEGGCIYLGETGCTIHDRAPAICREFDCRRSFLKLGDRTMRRRLLKAGIIDKEVLEAGRKRLDTLPEWER